MNPSNHDTNAAAGLGRSARFGLKNVKTLPCGLLWAIVGLSLLVVPSMGAAGDDEAIEAIRKAGGRVAYDPDAKVAEVDFDTLIEPAATTVSDEALRHLKGVSGLRSLSFSRVAMTDAQMEYLKDLRQLRTLHLFDTKVTDAGLMHVRGLTGLTKLSVRTEEKGKLTDAGMEHLAGLTHLRILDFLSPDISDSGLKPLKDLKDLERLTLCRTRVTGVGLEHVKGASRLTELWLLPTAANDAGLEKLRWFPRLKFLAVGSADVTDQGMRHLEGLTELTALILTCPKVTDAGLRHMKGLNELTDLTIWCPQVSDAGLENLVALPRLRDLDVRGTRVTEAALKKLSRLDTMVDAEGKYRQRPGLRDNALALRDAPGKAEARDAPWQAETPDAHPVTNAIRKHFKTVTPELIRYERATFYGETLSASAISKEAMAREAALFKDAAAAGLLKSPPDELLCLGHNLIVHDPAAGRAYLTAFHEHANLGEERVKTAMVFATLAAGEPGEEMAVAELASKIKDRRAFWASYLERGAVYPSSVKPIQTYIAQETDSSVKASLIRALCMIGDPDCVVYVKDLVERATDDEVQAAALFAYVELAGFDGIAYLEKLKPIGVKSSTERKEGLAWLRAETRPDNKHGIEIGNSSDFVHRFGDFTSSPVIAWLEREGLLQDKALKDPPRLSPEKKRELLGLIIESKGFGLEAAKGTLFRSLSKEDEPLLLRIRAVSHYSPNEMSTGRSKTIGIMVRHLRQGQGDRRREDAGR